VVVSGHDDAHDSVGVLSEVILFHSVWHIVLSDSRQIQSDLVTSR
jgi:hypothetical protein